jgi:hypothetical protein
MANLTAKQEAFINRMSESEELAHWGFELLLKRDDCHRFFDALEEVGLFDPSRNPAPIPAEEEGYVRIPFWSALDYLTAVAKLSGERNDLELAGRVMTVVRSVVAWRDPEGHPRDNFHTARKFAEIFGLVPTSAVTIADINFIPAWLNSRFERMLVGKALDDGALRRFLASSSPEDRNKAVLVLRHCTAIEWLDVKELGAGQRKPRMAVDGFWIKELIVNHAPTFGKKIGEKAADVFLERAREVFGTGTRKDYSQMYRPAIEENYQNHEWHEVENCSVQGLRDVLLSWCEADPKGAKCFVEKLLADELEILRRVGIYVLGQQWATLRDLYPKLLTPNYFVPGHFHELYNLLDSRFACLSDSEKAETLNTIRQIPLPGRGDHPADSLKRIQHRWLSAITGKNCAPADEWFKQLESDPTVGPVPNHPDFGSYMERSGGPGPSPYSAAELVAFTAAGIAVEKLNSFEEQDPWRGPTTDGLSRALVEAVRAVPDQFLQRLSDFLRAKQPFQYAVISGLREEWQASDRKKEIDWTRGWQNMILFFEQLIGDARFWQQEPTDVASAVADCLRAGTTADDHAYEVGLLPRTQALIGILLDKARAADRPSNEPMTQAISTPKGRAVEALFSQALRACRVSDSATGSHEEQWNEIRPLFDVELSKCENANYEFSVLSGEYLPQLQYMDAKWTKEQISKIFPSAFESNSLCAIAGLGYASFTRSIYSPLVDAGVVDRGLRYALKGHEGRGKLLQRIAAAYLWGDETLDSPRLSHILELGDVEDLETVTRTFWMVRGEKLSDEQKGRIVQYWTRCIARTRRSPEAPIQLFSSLSMLTCYLSTADGQNRELLEAVAPCVHVGHYSYEFIEQLVRLAEVSPDSVSAILRRMIEGGVPEFDYKDQLKALLHVLIGKGKKEDVVFHAERLRTLPGIQEIFNQLTRGN